MSTANNFLPFEPGDRPPESLSPDHLVPADPPIKLHLEPALENSLERSQLLALLAQTRHQLEESRCRERALAEQHHKQLFMVQHAPTAIVEWNAAMRVVDWNPAAAALFGYSNAEMVGLCAVDFLVPPAIRSQVKRLLFAVMAGRESVRSTNENITKDGSRIVCDWCNTPLVDANGEVTGFVSMTLDVTQKAQVEADLRQSTHQITEILQSIGDGFLGLDAHWRFTYVNHQAEVILQRRLDDLLGKVLWDEFSDLTDSALYHTFQQALIDQIPVTFEQFFVAAQTWFEIRVFPYQAGLSVYFRDIGDRKFSEAERLSTEQRLKDSEMFLNAVMNGSPDPLFVKDQQHRYLMVNDAFCALIGRDRAEMVGRLDQDLFAAAAANVYYAADQRVLSSGQPEEVEESLTVGSGEVRLLSAKKSCFLDAAGNRYVVCTLRDITDRRTAEADLRRAKEGLEDRVRERTARLQETVSQLQQEVRDRRRAEQNLLITLRELKFQKFALDQAALVSITDPAGYITYANDKVCEISGYSRYELIGQNHRIFKTDHHPPEFFEQLWTTITRGQVWRGEVKNRCKNGSFFWVDLTIVPLLGADGTPDSYLGIHFDVSDRKQAEDIVRQSEAQLRQQAADLEATLRELRHTQSHLIQSEKMSALGQLVAGVAHEINNPVNFISGNVTHATQYTQDVLTLLSLYQTHYPDPALPVVEKAIAIDLAFLVEDLPKLLASMKVGAERIQKIVVSLRNFSRMDEAESKTVNLHDGIDNTLMILENRLKAQADQLGIQVIKNYGDLSLVECYAGQLNQVFMNIISNAIDALESAAARGKWSNGVTPAPTIRITTAQVAGDRVTIRIRDNGIGISEAVKHRLFDPFFTTKAVGKGTGLGMSISYQVVTERHGGSLRCFSALGEGAEFVVEIPIQQHSTTA